MSEYPYAAYYNFFAEWFGNIWFITFAFLLWLVLTIHWAFMLKGKKLWLRVPLAFIVSALHYLVFGLLIAGGRFGGEAEFLYDPALLGDNLFVHGGLQGILLWPLSLLPTGGIWIVIPVVIIRWVFWHIRSSRRRRSAE